MPHRSVSIWLLICCFMVYSMILIGGITRLTQSGLSMVTWQPVQGALPPLNEQQWQQEFENYKQYPEYKVVNRGMSLSEFKSIFWWEYIHRLLGRMIGVVFLLPLLFFALTKRLERPKLPIYFGLFLLGGLQGLVGWYMVKSGLVNDPHVSQYRLVIHLSLAVLIYALMIWLFFMQTVNKANSASIGAPNKGRGFLRLLLLLIGLMIVSGGFMAGTKAGFIFNTFPKMGASWLPEHLFALTPGWRNLFENTVTIQFLHRTMAMVTLGCVVAFYVYMRRSAAQRLKPALNLLLCLVLLQVGLGIATLLAKVPVVLGVMHQGGAILLLTAAIYTAVKINKA